jgi:hypothetical protein
MGRIENLALEDLRDDDEDDDVFVGESELEVRVAESPVLRYEVTSTTLLDSSLTPSQS